MGRLRGRYADVSDKLVKRIIPVFIILVLISNNAFSDYIGTITIPSINCVCDLTYYTADVNNHQHVAMLYEDNGCLNVGNHHNSMTNTGGLWKIENIRIGDKAYLNYTENGNHHAQSYRCYAILIADVSGENFTINGCPVIFMNSSDLICCTCANADGSENYIAVFKPYN